MGGARAAEFFAKNMNGLKPKIEQAHAREWENGAMGICENIKTIRKQARLTNLKKTNRRLTPS